VVVVHPICLHFHIYLSTNYAVNKRKQTGCSTTAHMYIHSSKVRPKG